MRVLFITLYTLKRDNNAVVKIYLRKVFECTISKPRFISNCFNPPLYPARAEKYLDESRFGKQYFPTLG